MSADSWSGPPQALIAHATMATQIEHAVGADLSVHATAAPADLVDPEIVPDELAHRIDTIIGFHFPAGALKRFPRLRWLHLTGTGSDHLANSGLDGGVLVTNSPRVAVVPVAEYAITGLLAVLKDVISLAERPPGRPWFGASTLTLLSGSRVAVVGAGRIGTAVTSRLSAMGARCVAVTRTGLPRIVGAEETVASPDLVAVAASLDHLVCCLPGGAATTNLVSAEVLAALPDHAAVVNVGRASTLDTAALHSLLRRGELRGAFLDVHDVEPLDPNDPAWSVPGLIVSPHCGFSFPQEAQEVAKGFFENLADLRAGRDARDTVQNATVATAPATVRSRTSGEASWAPDEPASADYVQEAQHVLERALREEAGLRPGPDTDTVLASLPRSREVLREVARAREESTPPGLDDPIVIVGLLRTGTSLLHNLLSLHPDLHGPVLWELADPVTAGGSDPEAARAAQHAAAGYVAEYNALSPDFAAIHYIQADRPDECHRLLANTFHSMVLEMRYRVPSYGQWLQTQDMAPAYREHRRALEVLMAGRVDRSGAPARPVIKCPFHTWALPALAETYPAATIIHLHRDPVEAVASTASLCRAVRAARSDTLDLHEIGRLWQDRILPLTEVLAEQRDQQLGGRPVLDLTYAQVVQSPEATLRSVCDAAGLRVDEPYLDSVRHYLHDNAQGSRGAHRYTPEQFGLDPEHLRARTAAYRARFGV